MERGTINWRKQKQEEDRNPNSSEESHDQFFSALNLDVITCILYKLPAETLILRWKRVSKRWHALISDPSFVDGYCRKHNHRRSLGFFVQLQHEFRQEFVPFDNDEVSCTALNRLRSWKKMKFEGRNLALVDAHKDVLLCCECQDNDIFKAQLYFLCNPHSGQSVAIPNPPSFLRSGRHVPYAIAKLVIDEEKQCFHVIRFIDDSSFSLHQVEAFSSETGEWKTTSLYSRSGTQISHYYLGSRSPAVLGSRVYFLAKSQIFAYNMKTERLELVQKPLGHAISAPDSCLWALGGSLLYVENSSSRLTIWAVQAEVLDEDNCEWGLVHSAKFSDIEMRHLHDSFSRMPLRYNWRFVPIAVHPTRRQVFLVVPGMILLYDLCTRRMEVAAEFTEEFVLEKENGFVFPYEALAWPTEIPARKVSKVTLEKLKYLI